MPVDYYHRLPKHIREQIDKYAYLCKYTGTYVLCSDDAKYMNHSNKPNVHTVETNMFASKSIEIGEELTCDYRDLSYGKYQQ
jgi:SET domain-containing protein